MRLIIENTLHQNLKPFINNIILPTTTQIFYSLLDLEQLNNFDRHLSRQYNQNIRTKNIITLALNNLIIYDHRDTYEITINPNIFIDGINAKLYDICALINYGNLEIPPYPIFDKTMDRLASVLPSLYEKYYFGE